MTLYILRTLIKMVVTLFAIITLVFLPRACLAARLIHFWAMD